MRNYTLAHPRLIRINSNAVTDHNRAPLQIDTTRISNEQRMADGTLRRWFVADKRTFTLSYDNLPAVSTFTVDGFWGVNNLETFYYANPGSFPFELTHSDGTVETFTVMWETFTKTLESRGAVDFYSLSATFLEV